MIKREIFSKEAAGVEYNDIYDENRCLTGRQHRRGSRWRKGEFGLVVCVWVYDGHGKVLLTRRAPEKTFAGTWENSGGAALAGENSRQAIARELFEETGIQAAPEEFELLESCREFSTFYDHYCLRRESSQPITLQPGETDAAKWVTLEEIQQMIDAKQICYIIARQFQRQLPWLAQRLD